MEKSVTIKGDGSISVVVPPLLMGEREKHEEESPPNTAGSNGSPPNPATCCQCRSHYLDDRKVMIPTIPLDSLLILIDHRYTS